MQEVWTFFSREFDQFRGAGQCSCSLQAALLLLLVLVIHNVWVNFFLNDERGPILLFKKKTYSAYIYTWYTFVYSQTNGTVAPPPPHTLIFSTGNEPPARMTQRLTADENASGDYFWGQRSEDIHSRLRIHFVKL